MSWRDETLECRKQPGLFFSDDLEETVKARLLCVDCPARIFCLDEAVRTEQDYGIWGATEPGERKWLAKQLALGPEAYRAGLLRVIRDLDEWIDTPDSEQPALPPSVCSRCGAMVVAASRPEDKNGPNATCGKPSTYNRGCRCVPCVVGKSIHDSKR